MSAPVILGAARSPLGAVHGALGELHPADVLAVVLSGLVERAGLDPADVAEVVCGCAEPVGGQGGDVARGATLGAGWVDTVGGLTIERGATSGLAALAAARALVASGAAPLVIAAAIDMPSVVPAGAAAMGRHPYGRPWGTLPERRALVPPGIAAERLGVGRDRQDDWSVASIERAHAASLASCFASEIVAVGGCETDEVPVRGAPLDRAALAELPPVFDPEGTVTSGNSARPADGAVAIAVADPDWAARHGAPALATLEVVTLAAAAPDDLAGAARDAAVAASRGGALPTDAAELPESTAALAVALQQVLAIDPAIANRWGGALALGEPLGASDLRAAVTLLHQLVRDDLAHGLVISAGLGVGAAARFSRP